MNGVQATGAFPATTVLQIASNRPMPAPANRRADDVIVAAVTHPPRFGETRPLADLMPHVLARYGLESNPLAGSKLAPGLVDTPIQYGIPGPGLVPTIDCEA